MFNRNSIWFGALIGILMPMIVYAALYGSFMLYENLSGAAVNFDLELLQLISPVVNLPFIRYYFVNKKYDDTGRGLLLVTFVFIAAFFLI